MHDECKNFGNGIKSWGFRHRAFRSDGHCGKRVMCNCTGKLCFCDGTENIRLWKTAAYQ